MAMPCARRCGDCRGRMRVLLAHTEHLGRKDDFQWVHGDIVEGSRLEEGMQGCDAVIHLVGHNIEKGTNTFERVHHLGTRNVVEAAKRTGIKRFVQMSASGSARRRRGCLPNHKVER